MTSRIKKLFTGLTGSTPGKSPAHFAEKDLAAAALMVEAAFMDGTLGRREKATIETLLTERLGLGAGEADELFEAALAAKEEATHLMRFTKTLKDNYSEEQRIEMIEMLWEVAYADGVIHDYEDNLIRRVAGLLYVSDHDRGAAKIRVRERFENGQ